MSEILSAEGFRKAVYDAAHATNPDALRAHLAAIDAHDEALRALVAALAEELDRSRVQTGNATEARLEAEAKVTALTEERDALLADAGDEPLLRRFDWELEGYRAAVISLKARVAALEAGLRDLLDHPFPEGAYQRWLRDGNDAAARSLDEHAIRVKAARALLGGVPAATPEGAHGE